MNTIIVHAYDWVIRDKGGDDEKTTIECWALDQLSKPYLLRIIDFPVFCNIELPLTVKGIPYKWTAYEAGELIDMLNRKLGNKPIIRRDFKLCQKLYYYQGNNTFPFIRVFFNNVPDMKSCKYKLDNPIETDRWGWIQLQVHEEQITVVRKLLTYKTIRFSSWFSTQATKVEEELRISSLENEFIVNWNTMEPVKDEICKEWVTNPGVLAWDIECYSDNHLAMPDKYNDAHVAYMISCIYKKYKIEGTYKRYAIIIGDCNEIDPAKLEHCIMIKVNDEIELVKAFADVVMETDPEILIGYNILGFDYPYLNHRIIRQLENWPCMGRILKEVPKLSSNAWKSKAYGNNNMSTLNISGRISIDLLPVIKRDNKFESYTLNYVCEYFLNKKKFDVSPQQMFIYYEQLRDAVEDYKINQSTENFFKLEQAKVNTTEVMEYCIRDSELCIDLMENQDVWVGLVELSNIVGVTIVEIFTKGQQVRCVSQLYNLACTKNIILNSREAPNYTFKGGSVQKPIPGLYDNVICLDFKSLYPSIIEALNICYSTLVMPEHDKYVPDDQCHVVEFDQEIDYAKPKKLKEDVEIDLDDSSSSEDELDEKVEEQPLTRHYKLKFYKNKQGLVPLLVKNLVSERNAVRGQQKTEKNPQVKMVLEKRQLALKTSANCVTGRTPIPCLVNGKFEYHMIEELFKSDYDTYEDGMQVCKNFDIKVWSDAGWADIKYIGRKKAPEKLLRILTHTGCVDVTEGHSLLNMDGEELKAGNVHIGDDLMHFQSSLPADTPDKPMYIKLNDEDIHNHLLNTIDEKRAFVHGMFLAEGTCGRYINANGKASWCIYNTDLKLLERCKDILNEINECNNTYNIYDPGVRQSKLPGGELHDYHCYMLRSYGDIVNLACSYRKMFYNNRKEKKVPNYIFSENYSTRLAFFVGYYAGDGERTRKTGIIINNKGFLGSAGLYYLSRSLGYITSISQSSRVQDLFRLQCCTWFRNENPNAIKNITDAPIPPKITPMSESHFNRNNCYLMQDNNENYVYYDTVLISNQLPRIKLLKYIDEIQCFDNIGRIIKYDAKLRKITHKCDCCQIENSILISYIKKYNKINKKCDCPQNLRFTGRNCILETETNEYVYDIETSTHHFAAGVGDMIVHNSFFGFFGVQEGGKLPCLEAAMAITAKGRELIAEVGTYLKKKYDAKIVYGDSVTGDTPILCKINNVIKYITIENIKTIFQPYEDKESCLCDDIQVWTEKGWTKLNRVIRHYTNKPIYRIITASGSVDVTSDHSLLNCKAEKVKPTDVKVGSTLLHADLPKRESRTQYLTQHEAFMMGYQWSSQSLPKIMYHEEIIIKKAFLSGYEKNESSKSKLKLAEIDYLLYETRELVTYSNEIQEIIQLESTTQYVYDLETENHHFSAGIGRLIVHNTDSVMVDMKIEDAKLCNYWGEKLAQEISGVKVGDRLPGKKNEYHTTAFTGLFLSPLAMEFEKAMRLYCIKPKMYAAYYVGEDGEFKKKTLKDAQGKIIKVFEENEMLTRGIPLVRRDKNKFLQMMYRNILDTIMLRGTFKQAAEYLIDNIHNFILGNVDYTLLKSTRELGAHYKQPSFYMKVFADELRKKNKIVNPGDRLEFIIVENPNTYLVGQKMILTSDYLDSLKTETPYKIDYMHYIEKVLMNPLDSQLFSIGFKEIDKLSHITYTPGRKRIPITLKNITEMIFYMIKNKINIMNFKKRLLEQIDLLEKPNQNYKFNIIQ